ncbi:MULTISPECIES: Scr1 family TA system antitoxin-like transcriptional regulator [unclassified Streptomyces]|uniref:Scr1 family TA system antitoxin-like transcriptional regulator n=1 Tax=unclassified Streptomyces TaxID=2593676 RepID=UPI001CA6BEA5|nr:MULTISPECIES: Scr1 family TA system antitoxin-like transcriptional regulator [unclassified Streptomyces]
MRVIPFTCEEFIEVTQPVVYAYGVVPQLDTVQIDSPFGGRYLDSEADLKRYAKLLDLAERESLNPEESRLHPVAEVVVLRRRRGSLRRGREGRRVRPLPELTSIDVREPRHASALGNPRKRRLPGTNDLNSLTTTRRTASDPTRDKYVKYLTYLSLRGTLVPQGPREVAMPAVHFENYTEARTHLKELLDAADEGRVATVRRASGCAAVVDVERLRHYLSSVCPSKAEVVAEAGGWSVFIPGLPVAADGPTFDEAVNEMVDALREYADDWQERLRLAPNHQDNWGLVQLIALSDDRQLTDWLVGVQR